MGEAAARRAAHQASGAGGRRNGATATNWHKRAYVCVCTNERVSGKVNFNLIVKKMSIKLAYNDHLTVLDKNAYKGK